MNQSPKDLQKEDGKYTSQIVAGSAGIAKKFPASQGMKVLNHVLDGIIVDSNQDVACKKGCFFCCNSEVELTQYELTSVVSYIRRTYGKADMTELLAKLRKRYKETRGKEKSQRMVDRKPCVLLTKEGTCSVYSARPLNCRAAVSYDAKACEKSLDDGNTEIPINLSYKDVANDISVGISIGTGDEGIFILADGLYRELKA